MKKCLVALLSLILVSSIIAGDIKEKISRINQDIQQNMLTGNLDAQLKYYAEDAYSLPNFSPMMHGMEEFKAAHKEGEAMGIEIKKFNLETVEIFEGSDIVVEIGKYSMTFTMAGMPEPMEDVGKYLTVFKKQDDGSLKIIVDTWNADKNPMEFMAGGGEHSEKESSEYK